MMVIESRQCMSQLQGSDQLSEEQIQDMLNDLGNYKRA